MKRLREFDLVTVNIPFEVCAARTIDMFDASVLAMVGPTAALEAVEEIDVTRLPPRVANALLSFRKNDALVGLKGTLITRHDSGALRFTVGDGVQLNRRSATRIQLAVPMRLHKLGTLDEGAAHSIDLSADGVLLETELRVSVGDTVQVTMMLAAEAAPIEATATVVREGEGLVAIQFDAACTGARSRLARLVVEHNRRLLRERGRTCDLVEF